MDRMTTIEPTGDEKLLAGLSHLSIFFFGVILPLIVWLLQREKSRFVAFQALQAMLYHLAGYAIGIVAYCCFFGIYFVAFIPLAAGGGSGSDAGAAAGGIAFIAIIGVISLIIGAGALAYIVIAIIAAVQGFQGKDYRYPIIGRWAERFMPPGPPPATTASPSAL